MNLKPIEIMNTENNKSFADFMVKVDDYWQKDDNQGDGEQLYYQPFNTEHQQMYPSEMLFNSDWNWLMAVVEKIFSEECIKPFAGNGMYYVLELEIEEALKKAKIEPVYNACVEFIKWYNEQK